MRPGSKLRHKYFARRRGQNFLTTARGLAYWLGNAPPELIRNKQCEGTVDWMATTLGSPSLASVAAPPRGRRSFCDIAPAE